MAEAQEGMAEMPPLMPVEDDGESEDEIDPREDEDVDEDDDDLDDSVEDVDDDA